MIMNQAAKLFPKGARLSILSLGRATFCSPTNIKQRIDGLVKKEKVVVFMKGTPDAPRCGFSNAVVQILNVHGVNGYGAHDVLSDEELRQGKV